MITYTIQKSGRLGLITPLPSSVLASTLLQYCSYQRQGAEWMPHPEWAWVRLYNIKRGAFPWGLLETVKDIFNKYISVYKDCEYKIDYDKQSVPQDITWNKILREYQREAITALLQNGGGILSMPTGSGKSLTIIEYLKIMSRKSLVVVTTLDIKRQWENWIGYNKLIDVKNYQMTGLKSIMKDYDIVVYDESHRVAAKTIYNLAMATKTDAIVCGCSATHYREDGESMRLEAALGRIVYSISRKKLIDEGYLSDAKITYIHTEYPNDGKYMDYSSVYKTNIVENDKRNKKIVDIALKEAKNNRKVLILVTQIEHGTRLLNDIKLLEPKTIFMNGSSEDRNIDYDNYNIIIGSNIYNEGVNIPAINVLILSGGGKSTIQLTQRIGRGLRKTETKEYLQVYDFIDTPKYLNVHYNKRRELVEEEFEVTEI